MLWVWLTLTILFGATTLGKLTAVVINLGNKGWWLFHAAIAAAAGSSAILSLRQVLALV